MSKKQANKQSRTVSAQPVVDSTFRVPDFISNVRLQSLLIFIFATLLYANTLTHGFVLDDAIVITDNMYTQQGVKGIGGILSKDTFFGFFKVEGKEALVSGGRYRPMTLVIAFRVSPAHSTAVCCHLCITLPHTPPPARKGK
ncbi:MAG: hypothetical protein LW693_14320 [Saprospiraceae bacterium]|nr:hypothetical protein [Saprospiraceae bacterium]